ncbi:unnamed protein product [Dovyalis caffra]|uniref:Uncharacterized protein n=1 Tax=Dovyalis caffra TaxID=77055 RepID=A0AAV1RMT8_9ROSI|nr:unnamed protein product [Dovyalis caffra]
MLLASRLLDLELNFHYTYQGRPSVHWMSDNVQRSESTKLLKEARKARGCPSQSHISLVVVSLCEWSVSLPKAALCLR